MRALRVLVPLALLLSPAAACSTTSSTSADAGVASKDAAAPDAAASGDGGEPEAASDAGAAASDASDSGRRWTHYEMPESGYPNGWLVASQGNSPNNWAAATVGGASSLNLFTNDPAGGVSCGDNAACPASQCVAGTCRQRVKQKSPRLDFGFGVYEWRVYVPAFSPADAQFSLGAFVYADDAHELDFECGPGPAAARASASLAHLDGSVGAAKGSEMLCVLTSQGNPASSKTVAVPVATWHTLGLAMTPDASDHYAVAWSIDGVVLEQKTLAFGPKDLCEMYTPGRKCTWQAFVSAENLAFLGDTYPKVRNDAHLDWFRFGE